MRSPISSISEQLQLLYSHYFREPTFAGTTRVLRPTPRKRLEIHQPIDKIQYVSSLLRDYCEIQPQMPSAVITVAGSYLIANQTWKHATLRCLPMFLWPTDAKARLGGVPVRGKCRTGEIGQTCQNLCFAAGREKTIACRILSNFPRSLDLQPCILLTKVSRQFCDLALACSHKIADRLFPPLILHAPTSQATATTPFSFFKHRISNNNSYTTRIGENQNDLQT